MGSRTGAAAARPKVVVANSNAAQQWEWHLARAEIASPAGAWVSPPIQTYAAWLEECWNDASRDEHGALLTPAQSAALWRRVVAESAASEGLIGHAGAAEWAHAAWTLLKQWRVDLATFRSTAQPDFLALSGWCDTYRDRLAAHDWLDPAILEEQLLSRPLGAPTAILASDLGDAYPARSALFARLAAEGGRVTEQSAPDVAGLQRAVKLPDATHELHAAVEWARDHLCRNARARVAIIVPSLEQRYDELARLLAAQLRDLGEAGTWNASGALARDPTVGAAVNALSLLTAAARHSNVGRWLRSPFFGPDTAEHTARARLDRELRDSLRGQLPFATAYARCGLRELLRDRVPHSAEALARGLNEVASVDRAAPSRWAHLWNRYLARLEWQAPKSPGVLLGWQRALDELARLTPIMNEISLDAALEEFARILERPQAAPLPVSGVHILPHLAAVGPGYDAVWATGFTDSFWPEAPRGNPLLPLALQRAYGMPYASPQDAQERSAAALARLVARVPDLVVSWPARVYDYETEPSPAIRTWPQLPPPLARPPRTLTAARETVVDRAPAIAGARLPGGTAALSRQARCPLRAFCQDRLGARVLEPIGFGLSARLRGIATHRAAELLTQDLPTQAELLAKGAADIAAAARRALAAVFADSRQPLRVLFDLEQGQLERVLAALLHSEAQRSPFRVRAVEEQIFVTFAALELRGRIDRVDELADGTLAIIDYKTSDRATSAAWFAARLYDTQVPLYATQAHAVVAAVAISKLTATSASYSGIWADSVFPGKRARAAALTLPAQIAVWRAALEQLAAEFAAGDTRVLVADYDDALRAFAPLTRIHEQLSVATGTTPEW